MCAMSEDGVLPKILQKKTKQKEVLVVSLSIYAALCIIILFFAKTFDALLSFVIFLDCIGMATSGAAIFKLRKHTKHLNGTGIYQIKWYPLIPVIFIGAYVFVALSIALDKPSTAFTCVCVLAGFMIIYFIFHKKFFAKQS
jgi:APA family basic amino acid/polyamine antiporter